MDIAFDESVTGVDIADFSLTRDGNLVPIPNTVTLTGSGNTRRLEGLGALTATNGNYTLTLVAAGSGIKDTAGTGNPLFVNASTSWRIDTTKPTATFSAVTPATRATPIDSITLTFSEPVTGLEKNDFTLKRGTTVVPLTASTLLTPASGPASTYVLSGLSGLTATDGTYTLEFSKDAGTKVVTDAAGNQMASNPTSATWTVNTTAPTATIALPAGGILRNAAVTTASVTFDMKVTGVDATDFRLTRNGSVVSLANATVTGDSGSEQNYTLTIPTAATTPDGAYVLTLVASGSGIAGKAAPFNPLQSGGSANWTMDGTNPTVSLAVIGKTSTAFTVRALFSEKVTGFSSTDTVNDVTISGGTIGNARNGTLAGREFLFDVTPTPPAAGNPIGPATVTVKAAAAKDAAGNDNTVSNQLRLVSDFTPPTVTLAAPLVTKDSPFTVTATFSEPVTGITLADLDVMTANANVDSVTGNGATYTFKVTPTGAGTVTVALNAKAALDGSSNGSLASNKLSVVYDNVQPTVTLASLSGNPSRSAVLSIAATFDEAVTGITANDLTVVAGKANVIGVTGSGKNYTFQVRPNADGEIKLKLPASAAFDAINNGSKVSDELTVVSDRTAPKVASMTGPADGKVTITLSEEVIGFGHSDFVLTRNGSPVLLSGVTLAGPSGTKNTEWTLDLTKAITLSGSYRLELAATTSGITDNAGNPLVDDRTSKTTTLIRTFAIDKTPPLATFARLPGATTAAVTSVGLSFTDGLGGTAESVTGLDLADLTLTRDGNKVNSLNNLAGVTLAPAGGSAATYTISGLDKHQNVDGVYAITLNTDTSGIKDTAGNALAKIGFPPNQKDAEVSWTLDTKRPTATLGLVPVTTAGIATVPVTFSEGVTGADATDFTLTRNGAVVPLAGVALVAKGATGTTFDLTGLSKLTTPLGEYALTLRAAGTGIVDIAQNQFVDPVVGRWIRVAPPATGSLTGAFAAVSPNPRTSPLTTLPVSFTASVTGVDAADFRLSRTVNGVTVPLPTTGLTVTGNSASRTVGGLDQLTKEAGQYELRLSAAGSGIADAGNATITLQSDIVASWTTTASAATATIALDAPPTTDAAYDAATITFSRAVTGMKLSALTLLRGGVPVSLTGTSFTALSQTTYKITGLAPLVATANSYELRLVPAGAGIVGLDGVPVQENAVVSWTQRLTSVRAAFLAVAPLIPSPLAAVGLRFNVAVRGVDVNDFELTVDRNDGRGPQAVALRGVIVSGSGVSWTISNLAALQSGPGTYTLRLKKSNGDIRSGTGATLAEDASVVWRVGTRRPGGGLD